MTKSLHVVKDKNYSIIKSSEIARDLLNKIKSSIKDFLVEDDPAEEMYLLYYIAGHFNGYIYKTLKNYGEIYGIEKMEPINTIPIIQKIATVVYGELKKQNI